MAIDLNDIADLPTAVATIGALRTGEAWGHDTFEYTIGVVLVVSGSSGG